MTLLTNAFNKYATFNLVIAFASFLPQQVMLKKCCH